MTRLLKLPVLFFTALTFNISSLVAASFVVSNTNDAGAGSLRDAIMTANGTAGAPHTITFNGSGTGTIVLASALPVFTLPIAILATGHGVILDGPAAGDFFTFTNPAGNGSSVTGLVLNNGAFGFNLSGVSNITISDCYIGTNAAGTAAAPNTQMGIRAINVAGCTFSDNVISGNTNIGLSLENNCTGNTINGNKIGTNALGTAAVPNNNVGLFISNGCSSNTVTNNVVSGNLNTGTFLGTNCDNNTISGNFFGTNAAGTAAIPNSQIGFQVSTGCDNNTISNNVISGNTNHGLYIDTNCNSNTIEGNKIGTNAAGIAAVKNSQHGLVLTAACIGNNIKNNVISGNGDDASTYGGIAISAGANNTVITGNYIGTNFDGTVGIGNSKDGIYITDATGTKIGSPGAANKNTISGNGFRGGATFPGTGVLVVNADATTICNSSVGTNKAGTAAIGNMQAGINILNSENITIGGGSTDSSNVISGNGMTAPGVFGEPGIKFENSSNARILGNFIGVSFDGSVVIPNAMGIYATLNCNNHVIGGSTSASGNVISGNRTSGIYYYKDNNDLKVSGNYIGTDGNGAGTRAVFGNGRDGIYIEDCLRPVIGGTLAGERNVISGNGRLYPGQQHGSGIQLNYVGSAIIRGNYIGLQADGTTAMGNGFHGITLVKGNRPDNSAYPGGSDNATIIGNGVSSNGVALAGVGQGVNVEYSHGVTLYGNYLGTDATGTLDRGNERSGISFTYSNNNIVGGTGAGEGNIMSANKELGVYFRGGTSSTVYNNKIGVAANGTSALGNKSGGLYILGVDNAGDDYVIGGTGANMSNTIAHNTGTNANLEFGNGFGIGISDSQEGKRNTISRNSIFCNSGPNGIDLNLAGDYAPGNNTPGNGGKLAPLITSSNGTLTKGTGTAGETILVYGNPSCGCTNGEIYLGTTTVAGDGTWSLSHAAVANPPTITSTAWNATQGTSQYSVCCTKPTAVIRPISPVCSGDSAKLSASPNTGATYEWFKDNISLGVATMNDSVYYAKTVGSYKVKISKICDSTSAAVTVVINLRPVAPTVNNPSVCSGNTVSLLATAPGGTYTWYKAVSLGTAFHTGANYTSSVLTGDSTFYVQSTVAGCSGPRTTVLVTVHPVPRLSVTNPPAVCDPNSVAINGAGIVTDQNNTTGVLSYWTDSSATAPYLTPGTVQDKGIYYIKKTTASTPQCFDIKPVLVTIHLVPDLNITHPPFACAPNTVDITAFGITQDRNNTAGSLDYWLDASATSPVSAPQSINRNGTFYIKKTTTTGNCSDIDTVVVVIAQVPNLKITDPNPVCVDGVDITSPAVISDSNATTGTYTYWVNSTATTVLANPTLVNASGTYYIKKTTAEGCTDIKPVIVIVNLNPVLQITDPAPVCAPLTVDITASPAVWKDNNNTTGTVSYWTDAAATDELTFPTVPSALTVSGTFYIKKVANNGCQNIKPVAVVINPSPDLRITNPGAVCAPNTVDLTLTPVVTDANFTDGTLSYWTNAAATISFTSPAAVGTTGSYYIKKTASPGGCTDVEPVLVTIHPVPNLIVTDPVAVCFPATVDITSTAVVSDENNTNGNYSYWTNAAATDSMTMPQAVAASGTYYIKKTTSPGCIHISPVAATIHAKPSLIVNTPAPVCSPATIDLTTANVLADANATIGIVSYWTNPSATIALPTPSAVAQSGTYYLKKTTTPGCSDTVPVTLTVHQRPELTITAPPPVCYPNTVNITAATVWNDSKNTNGTVTYWADPESTAALSAPAAIASGGTYYIKKTTNTGNCTSSTPVIVVINSVPDLQITDPPSVCAPSTVDLAGSGVVTDGNNTSGNLSYWTDAAATSSSPAVVSISSVYYIKKTTSGNCTDIQPVNVLIHPSPSVKVTHPGPVCAPAKVDITNSWTDQNNTGGTANYWMDKEATNAMVAPNTVDISGTYYIQAATSTGCSDIQPVTVLINPKPRLKVTNPLPACTPNTVNISTAWSDQADLTNSMGTVSYWTDSTATVPLMNYTTMSTSGTYYIQKTMAAGSCTDLKPVIVMVHPTPLSEAGGADRTFCVTADSTILGTSSTPGYTYFWTPTNGLDAANSSRPKLTLTADPDDYPPVPTTYTVKTITSFGCFSTDAISITVYPEALADPGPEQLICQGKSIPIGNDPINGYSYSWTSEPTGFYNTTANPTVIPVRNTLYFLSVFNGGCTDTNAVRILVDQASTLYIPNAFTPNSDGKNDLFKVGSEGIVDFKGSVFNRWGELIFEWDDVNEGWNGKINGAPAQEDVYVYHITAQDKCESRETKPIIGTVSLIK